MHQPSKTVQTWTCSQVYKLLTLYQPPALVNPLSWQCPGHLEVQYYIAYPSQHPCANDESCLCSCSVKKPDCDLTRFLDRVVDKESTEETNSDKEVVEDGAEEGIPGPEEAKMLNNQELEGDCILVENMLEITDHTPLSSEVSTSRAERQHWIRHLEQNKLIRADFGCEQAVLEKELLCCSSPECNFAVSSPALNFPLWH